MNRKVAPFFLALFIALMAAPFARAADTPLLTWERGKIQNIVLGAPVGAAPLSIQLVSEHGDSLDFTPSHPNSQGFRVYSIILPSTFPTGSYQVEVNESSRNVKDTVAIVDVIETSHYSVTQVPSDLRYILLILAFLFSSLTTIRSKKYSEISYVRKKDLVENGSLTHDSRFNSVLYQMYSLRAGKKTERSISLFSFLFQKNGRFLHEASPVVWALAPVFSLALGLFAGFLNPSSALIVSIAWMAVGAVVGMLDCLAGASYALGFAVFQICTGRVTSLREMAIVGSLAISWSIPSLVGDLLKMTAGFDFKEKSFARRKLVTLFSSLAVFCFFEFSQNFTRSLSPQVWPSRFSYQILGLVLALLYYAKRVYEEKLVDMWSASATKDDNLIQDSYRIHALFSKGSLVFIFGVFYLTGYLWTDNWKTAGLIAVIFILPLLALIVRFERPFIGRILNWNRNIFLESSVVTLASFALLEYTTILPFTSYSKALVVTFLSIVPVIIHALLGNLYDAAEAIERGEKLRK